MGYSQTIYKRDCYLIHGTSEKNSDKQLELENKLTDLQKKYNANPSNELQLQFDATKTALRSLCFFVNKECMSMAINQMGTLLI